MPWFEPVLPVQTPDIRENGGEAQPYRRIAPLPLQVNPFESAPFRQLPLLATARRNFRVRSF